MALIVETGAVVADADSYVSVDDARTIAAKYGLPLDGIDSEVEVYLRSGYEYVSLHESRFNGSRVSEDQTGSWPRVDATNIYGFDISPDSIPNQAIYAQVAAASEYSLGTDVRASSDGKMIASEEVVGAVKQSYFNNGKASSTVEITKSLDFLRPLFTRNGSNGFSFYVSRG